MRKRVLTGARDIKRKRPKKSSNPRKKGYQPNHISLEQRRARAEVFNTEEQIAIRQVPTKEMDKILRAENTMAGVAVAAVKWLEAQNATA